MLPRKQNAPEDERAAITVSERAFLYVRVCPADAFSYRAVIFAAKRVDEVDM